MKKKLAIIGSGDLGQQIAYHAANDGNYNIVGYYDDWAEKGQIKGFSSVLGNTLQILNDFDAGFFDELMIGIGYKHMSQRKEFFETFSPKIPFAKIIHSSSYVDKSANIGQGVFIYPGCVIDMNVVIEDNVFLNVSTTVAHDSIIGKHCMISPSVKIAGFVKIEECVNLGIGTIVIDNITICSHSKTGGGAVVVKNIEKAGLYVGIPAQKIK
jgi:sugar O-acyltransferase (sialic acid O-acetyltransferase NeuD family)